MDLSQKIRFIEDLLYSCGEFEYLNNVQSPEYSAVEELAIVKNIQDSEILHLYAYNYNWDNGLDIPNAIIENPNCDISTALMLLFIGDNAEYLWYGSSYGEEVEVDEYNQKWLDFLTKLADKLMNGDFKSNGIAFENPLSNGDKYRISRFSRFNNRVEKEVFFQSIQGKNLDICI